MQRFQTLQEQAPEQTREHAHRQEEVRPAPNPAIAVRRDAAARHDAVDVRMMIEVLAPRVQHRRDADIGAQMLRIGGDGGQRLGRGGEQEAVDLGLVLVGDGADRCRQREDHVEVGDRQQLRLAGLQPRLRRRPLALGTVAVAAGVVGYARVPAVVAALDMAAERRGATELDRRHDAPLAEAQMTLVGGTPSGAVAAEDIRHLQPWTRHGRRLSPALSPPCSRARAGFGSRGSC